MCSTASGLRPGMADASPRAPGALERVRLAKAQRPAASMPKDDARRRRFPEIACLLFAGTRSARRPPKLSEVTIPSATSSASACSTWVLKRRVPSTISRKNDAPVSRIKSTTRAPAGLGGTPFGADEIADQRPVLGLQRRVMGVERTGEA
jgi:hypothetical protein